MLKACRPQQDPGRRALLGGAGARNQVLRGAVFIVCPALISLERRHRGAHARAVLGELARDLDVGQLVRQLRQTLGWEEQERVVVEQIQEILVELEAVPRSARPSPATAARR